MKRLVACVVVSTAIAVAFDAHADSLRTCNSALVRGQELQRQRKFLEARAEYPKCLEAACDASLRDVCAKFAADLATRLPSLLVTARARTRELVNPRVFIDTAMNEGGVVVDVDPGEHVVKVVAEGFVTQEKTVLLREGERATVVVDLEPLATAFADTTATTQSSAGIPTGSLVLGGFALAGAASFATFGLMGKSAESDLRTTCPLGPCDSSEMRRDYLIADISLVAAVVASGAAIFLALSRSQERAVVVR